jgi:hypothetical protein
MVCSASVRGFGRRPVTVVLAQSGLGLRKPDLPRQYVLYDKICRADILRHAYGVARVGWAGDELRD